jgi:hypothetical protein
MPIRDRLETADCHQVVNSTSVNHSVGKILGYRQSISALNNVGKFVPGVFRVNPVVLEKHVSLGTPARSTGTDVYGANKGTINGHVAAHIMNACVMSPLSSNWYFYTQWDSTAAGHSLQKAYASMNEAALDVGVMLGELRETLAGLANPLTALRDYAKLANKLGRQGKRPKGSDTLNMLSGSWLEWRYGIQPLILSIQDIIEHVRSQALALQGKLLRKGGKVKYEKQFSVSGGSYPGSYYLYGDVDIEVKTKYRSVVFYNVTRPLSWQETYGMNLGSLPGIAWELATLSFVWDWFFSVGDWLGSLKTSDARTVLGSTTSQKSTVVATARPTKIRFYNAVDAKCSPGELQITYEKLDRRINQPLPLGPVVNREALSLKRQVDALTLLWQSMPKIRR